MADKRILFLHSAKVNEKFLYTTKLLCLVAVANSIDFETEILDFATIKKSNALLKDFQPSHIVAEVSLNTYKENLELLSFLKKQYPNICVIITAPPCIAQNVNTIYENPFIDYVIFADDEFVLKDILTGVPKEEILGISYLHNMQGIKNDNREYLQNLDSFPFLPNNLNKHRGQCVIQVSRGCPDIEFADTKTLVEGNCLRIKSPEAVIREITDCIDKYNIKNFYFDGEVFSYSKDWTVDFCNKLIKQFDKISWSAKISPKFVDEDLLRTMKKAGCKELLINLYSGNDSVLASVDAKYTVSDIKNAFNMINKYKIKSDVSFFIGLPSDTLKTVEETILLAKSLNSNNVSFKYPVPEPGTRFFAYGMLNKLIDKQIVFHNNGDPIVRTHSLSKEQLKEIKNKAEAYTKKRFWQFTKKTISF